MYKLSKDYHKLYTLVESDKEVVCFVDYNFRSLEGKEPPKRDVCVCRKLDKDSKHIEFLARGICYAGVHDFDKDKSDETIEKEFVAACEMKNVEFIEF